MANWDWAMNTILPPRNGEKARISGNPPQTFAVHRARGSKGGVDISYPSNDGPPVYSPIAGIVRAAGSDNWNTVNIEDASGNRHGFLHMSKVTVRVGQSVSAGTQIGFEGGVGPRGGRKVFDAYTPHVHYQLTLKKTGNRTDPVAWWNQGQDAGEVAENQDEITPEDAVKESMVEAGGGGTIPEPPSSSPPAPPVGAPSEYAPVPASPSAYSMAPFALWTNRVPQHEPWARVMLLDETTNEPTSGVEHNVNHVPQYDDDGTEDHSGQIGKNDGLQVYNRNPFWRR